MEPVIFSHEYFMKEAFKEARTAFENNEVPVGAVVVANNMVVARAHNQTEILNDVTAHAEMLAITSAANNIGNKLLTGCTLYVTLEPCVMCAGALFWSQVSEVVYGAQDPKRGYSRVAGSVLHPKTLVTSGILECESSELLKRFFSNKR